MRLIDADALMNSLDINNFPGELYAGVGLGIAKNKVSESPTVDAVPIKRGKWRRKLNEKRRIHRSYYGG